MGLAGIRLLLLEREPAHAAYSYASFPPGPSAPSFADKSTAARAVAWVEEVPDRNLPLFQVPKHQRVPGAITCDKVRLNDHSQATLITDDRALAKAWNRGQVTIMDVLGSPCDLVDPLCGGDPLDGDAGLPPGTAVRFLGISPASCQALQLAERAATFAMPCLITGETGTGKNVVARTIHQQWARANQPYLSINCAALPENLIEAELFGHERGSFTGASQTRQGIFELARGGTLVLDEITEMPLHLQAKLLSVLEDKVVRRLGGEEQIPVEFRLVAITSTDVQAVLDKKLRRDLYFRLNVVEINLPPLRERTEDIPFLCRHILNDSPYTNNRVLQRDELRRMCSLQWPGNIRELKNILQRAAILQPGLRIQPSLLVAEKAALLPEGAPTSQGEILPLSEVERRHILSAMRLCGDNMSQTARTLGISLSTLKRRLKDYRSNLTTSGQVGGSG